MGSDGLGRSKLFAQNIRFAGDKRLSSETTVASENRPQIDGLLAQTGLEISQYVTPSLSKVLSNVYDSIKLASGHIDPARHSWSRSQVIER
jgi:hypothetical protein